jgi:hypothetical protein
MTNKIYLLLIIFLIPFFAFSQKSLYIIAKPKNINRCNEIREVICIAEADSLIGKFTSDFIGNISKTLNSNNIVTHQIFKTPKDSIGQFASKNDSVFSNYKPNGLILLRLKRGVIAKTSIFGNLENCFVFHFQYSHIISMDKEYVQLFSTTLTINANRISETGISVSNELIKMMKKEKIIEQ